MMLFDAHPVFDRLVGAWGLIREVSGQASMTGAATITATEDGVARYEESVRVTLVGGRVLRGERRYVYRRTAVGFDVYFAETGKLFHALTFAAGEDGWLRANASHDCVEDVYRSEYAVGPEDEFQVRHVVHGPRKDYAIETIYTRRPMSI